MKNIDSIKTVIAKFVVGISSWDYTKQ